MSAKAKSTRAKRGKSQPTITRAPHDKDNPYAQIRRASLEDEALSWEARGLLGYLLAKPSDWKINVTDLVKSGNAGRDKVYRMLGELEAAGYLKRTRTRSDDNTFAGIQYHLYEEPRPEKPDMDNQDTDPHPENPDTDDPHTDSPDTAEPDTENPTHTNKEVNTNKENNTKDEGTKDCPADAERSLTPWQKFMGALCWVCYGHDKVKALTEEQTGQLTSEAKKIKELGFDIDDLRTWYKEVWRVGWQVDKNSNSRPVPSQVRTSLPSIRADTPDGFDDESEPPQQSTNRRMSKIDNNMLAIDQAFAYLEKHGVNPL